MMGLGKVQVQVQAMHDGNSVAAQSTPSVLFGQMVAEHRC